MIIRKAEKRDAERIWNVIQDGIARRKKDGSTQWQNGYPNPEVISSDISREIAYVLTEQEEIIGYMVIIINDEPAYDDIEGAWLTHGDFLILHRIALADGYAGKGLSGRMLQFAEDFAKKNHIPSIKADTNDDNIAMARMFEKNGYVYCGKVFVNGGIRNAYEKVLDKSAQDND